MTFGTMLHRQLRDAVSRALQTSLAFELASLLLLPPRNHINVLSEPHLFLLMSI